MQALVAADTAELQCLGRCVEQLLISPDQNILDIKSVAGAKEMSFLQMTAHCHCASGYPQGVRKLSKHETNQIFMVLNHGMNSQTNLQTF